MQKLKPLQHDLDARMQTTVLCCPRPFCELYPCALWNLFIVLCAHRSKQPCWKVGRLRARLWLGVGVGVGVGVGIGDIEPTRSFETTWSQNFSGLTNSHSNIPKSSENFVFFCETWLFPRSLISGFKWRNLILNPKITFTVEIKQGHQL